jgi:hypothetical protein
MLINIGDKVMVSGEKLLPCFKEDEEYIVIAKDIPRNVIAVEHPDGNLRDVKGFLSVNPGDWDVDEGYFPCNLFTLRADRIKSVTRYAPKGAQKESRPGSDGDKAIDFFFPKDKLNPKRDPNSPWEFL